MNSVAENGTAFALDCRDLDESGLKGSAQVCAPLDMGMSSDRIFMAQPEDMLNPGAINPGEFYCTQLMTELKYRNLVSRPNQFVPSPVASLNLF